MGRIKIRDLAKKLNIDVDALIDKLKDSSFQVKSGNTFVDEEAVRVFLNPSEAGKTVGVKKRRKVIIPTSPPKYIPVMYRQPRQRRGQTRTKTAKAEVQAKAETEAPRQPALKIEPGITVQELAENLGVSSTELIKVLMSFGEMATITKSLSDEAVKLIGEDLGVPIEIVPLSEQEEVHVDKPGEMESKPPVVTVMGHVDHGKTSLLDAIRETEVTKGEFGGITQHIGAYQVVRNDRVITFIDTPGHEAFTAMRARGAKVTDIAVLVVAADDGVMPQTVEAINHARAANVPILIAINKIDKAQANPDKVKHELADQGLVPEEWGGETIFVEVSAKKRINIDELLEMVLLVADVQELKANRKANASGTIIEAKLDRGRGPVATVLVQRGTLKQGQYLVAGSTMGRIRVMVDEKGRSIKEAYPGQPVEIVGISSVPQAGDFIKAVPDERTAKQIAQKRIEKVRAAEMVQRPHVSLDDLFERIKEGELQELNLVIKADVHGSIEALEESLMKLDQREIKLNIIHRGVGAISETDVSLAAASNAIVIGFNVRPDQNAKMMAEKENVDVRLYNVIYKVIEDITSAMSGMLAPEVSEVDTGTAEVRQTFKVSRIGTIAGCYVTHGEITRSARVRVVRDGTVIYQGNIASLKRFKEDVKEVKEGFECGILVENFQDVKEGDIIEAFVVVETPREL